MLRYNNQSGMSKPVDYYRPLTVDVSVEYELPKEVAPPPGSAPLLIIHPSAYFRSKVSQPSSSSSHTSSSSPASHKNVPMPSRGSRHDLNPTLYYLNSANSNSNRGTVSTSSLVGHHNNQNHLTSNHIKSLRHGSSMSGSITRSRSVAMASSDQQPVRGSLNLNCPYGKYEDYSSGNGGVGGMSASSASLTSSLNNRVSSAMKKVGIHPTERERERERLSYSNNYGNGMTQSSTQSSHNALSMSGNHNLSANVHGSVVGSSFAPTVATSSTPMMTTTSSNAAPGLNFGGVVGSTISQSGTVSNKRLRMMNQQQHQNLQQQQHQQQQQQQQHQSNLHNPPQQPMEPLNLAITPSASNSLLNPSYHNSIQLSTFFGNNYSNSGGGGSNKASHGLSNTNSYGNIPNTNNNNINNNSSISSNGSHMTGLGLNYGSTFPNNYRTSNPTTTSQSLYMAQSARFPKECPVPVDKGSGSDSGVCSENDSDVSPPMAPFSGHPRRSILSQELPTTGCYCCCCPTTTSSSSSSSRKNSGLSSSTASTTSSHSKSKSSSLSSSNNSNHQNQNQNQHGNQNQNQNQQNIMMSSQQQQYLQHPLGANNSNTSVSSKLSGHHGSSHHGQQHGGGGGVGHHGLYSSSNNNTNNNLSSSGNTSNSSGSLFNYGMNSLNPTISMNMNMLTMQHDGLLSNSMSTESSSSLSASHLDLDSTYRKWFGSGLGSGLVVDANTSSLGRWFQV